MFYEVTIPSGSSSIIEADTGRQAKGILCKQNGIHQSDPWCGISSMEARKLRIDFPETIYQPNDVMDQLAGKDLILYDEHHGAAVRIHNASVESIRHFLDEYTSIIVL